MTKFLLCWALAFSTSFAPFSTAFAQGPGHRERLPPKKGVADAAVKVPLSRAVPEAKFNIPGAPDWIAVDEDVWISNKPKNNVTRLDPRSNTIKQVIGGFHKPCSGLAVGFGSLWVPNCGDKTLARVDLKTGQITGTIATGTADTEGGLTTGAGKVWLLTDKKSTLAGVDPESNRITSTLMLPAGCYNVLFGFDSLWVTCNRQNTLVRVDPVMNKVLHTIAVGPGPRFLCAGEGAIWTLNQGDGSISRISPLTNRVESTIEVGIPGPGGDISASEGSVWATSIGFPISRIDPKANRVTQQFVGKGGDAIRAGRGAVWLSNYMLGSEWKFNPRTLLEAKSE
jgi:virginiamycin B lyase